MKLKHVPVFLMQARKFMDRNDKAMVLHFLGVAKNALIAENEPQLAGRVEKIITMVEAGSLEGAKKELLEVQKLTARFNAAVEKEMKKERGGVVIEAVIECPYCKKEIPKKSNFCAYCGKRIVRIKCPQCKKEVLEGENFCMYCGYKLM